jgi:hypothetical protein
MTRSLLYRRLDVLQKACEDAGCPVGPIGILYLSGIPSVDDPFMSFRLEWLPEPIGWMLVDSAEETADGYEELVSHLRGKWARGRKKIEAKRLMFALQGYAMWEAH